MTSKEYEDLNKKYSPPTKSYRTIPMAFLIGGLICTLGQAFIQLYTYLGLEPDIASSCASISLVLIAAVLTGLNVFDDIAAIGSAGCLVPITGFSNAVTAPALDFKSEGFILGLGAKMFVIAGPVIVYGVLASVGYGLLYFLFGR